MTGLTQAPAPPGPSATPPATPATRRRSILSWIGVIVVLAGAVVGSNVFDVRDRLFGSAVPEAAPAVGSRDAFTAVGRKAPAHTALRSQPWWQDVTTLQGTGSATARQFAIGAGAIQWRVRASCDTGRLVVRVPTQDAPLVDAACPTSAVREASGSGAIRADVRADGRWRLAVSQQIDAPLVEPPLRAMSAPGATRLATGSFFDVDNTGKGTVTVLRQADGRYALRLTRFFVSPTADLELRLSPHRAPRTTRQYRGGDSRLVAVMDVTAGSLNFSVPAGVDPGRFRSVVIWCASTANVYAAAALRATR